MRKLAAIILLFALCFNGTGYYMVHLFLQKKIRKEIKYRIKQNVPREELVIIRYSDENADQFQWIHPKEFRYKETMYDVVSSEQAPDGSTLYECITDYQESKLFANLNKWVNDKMNSNPATSKTSNLFSSFIGGLFPPPVNDELPVLNAENIRWINKTFSYFPPQITKSTPPPKSLFNIL